MTEPGHRPKPLYWRVADDISAKVDAGVLRPGDKLPSERALCERYGVSQITVRRSLRELAHMGRVYSRHGLGWFVSESRDSRRSSDDEVALVLPRLDWVTVPLVHSLSKALAQAGVSLRLAFTGGDSEEEAKALRGEEARVTAAVLLVVTGEQQGLADRYALLLGDAKLPVLLLLREVSGVEAPVAFLDERAAMEDLARHILSLGHRRVAYAGDDPSRVAGWERYRGFATALWERGLELPLDWMFASKLTGDAAAERFRRVFGSQYHPTGLVCSSDARAAEAMLLLQGMGLSCPAEVAIVGLGDRDFAPLLSPPLTTYRFELQRLGQAAAAMILDLLAGRQVEDVKVSGQIVVRESCGAGSQGVF